MLRSCKNLHRNFVNFLLQRNSSHYSTESVDKRWPGWRVVIGLEVHVQLKSRAKLFSQAWTSKYDEEPNSHVAAFDAAFPGTLPKLNLSCVDLAIRAALALNSQLQRRCSFDRKHYFYSDLPSGYQITQHYAPLAKGGSLQLSNSQKSVRIKQIQLEQDTAKSTFDQRSQQSTVDLNRAGTALIEVVSEPDMRTPKEAGDYVRTLQSLLRTVGASDCNMEEGSLRCDANVSVNRISDEFATFGTRCEIKNLNSVKFMMTAITSEVLRQINVISRGEHVKQETRGFNEETAETHLLRSKEDAPDYRYMPDPNLPPLFLDESYIMSVRATMPELPSETRSRLLSRGLSSRDVDFLMSINGGHEVGFDGEVGDGGAVAYFDNVSEGRDAKVALNWITHDLYGFLVAHKQTFKDNPISVDQMRDFIRLIEDGRITATSAKVLLKQMIEGRKIDNPAVLAEELGLMALADDSEFIDELCQSAISALPEEASAVRSGNLRVVNRLVGHVMKASRGRAEAMQVQEKLKVLLRVP